MNNYCRVCKYFSNCKQAIEKHVDSKKHIDKNVDDKDVLCVMYKCKHCENLYKNKSSLTRHIKSCSKNHVKTIKDLRNYGNDNDNKIKLLEEELATLKKELLGKEYTGEKIDKINDFIDDLKEKPKTKVKVVKTKDRIPQAVRRVVWNNYTGETEGNTKCYVGCGTVISQMSFECGHIVSENNGGKTVISNLRPICSLCNKSMGTRNLEDFKKTYEFNKK